LSAAALLLAGALGCAKGKSSPACEAAGLSGEACDEASALQLPAALPPARGNDFADSPAAAQLGFQIFFDARFSSDQNTRCESCHQPELEFQDGLALPQAMGFVGRRTPTTINAARMSFQFWDGRADSLWSQPLFALENPAEMNFTRLEIAHQLQALYASMYAAAFGPLPDLSDASRFPAAGKPGSAAWDAMAPADQDTINRIVANLGKSMEAYLRLQSAGGSRVDQFLGGDLTALSADEQRGLGVFVSARCTACHAGPALSDVRFHNLGVAASAGQAPDRGRADGIQTLLANPFNAHGPYFDGPPPAGEEALYQPSDADLGAFRTPSLRNLSARAPYGHNGTFATLDAVVDFHLAGGGRGQSGFVGVVDPLLQPQTLSAADRAALLAFLHALDGTPAPLPWSDWPQR